ncbi:NAD(P)/FAD-dependent oxidoreductase [Poseidonibacter sp.]|uniref:NAD(P)/FAD-dependent oxidoreductase n=1 Tax=Poseidonibacter sp. TaxID=2321188 RepID=UPI003C769EA0
MANNQKKITKLSRRDAIKLAGLSSFSCLLTSSKVEASNIVEPSNAKGKILIIGGGLAGISTAARLVRSLENPNITIIEPNPKSVSYQAGNSFIAAGIFEKSDILYKTRDFIPKSVTVIKDKAIQFLPDENKVVLSSNEILTYDFLIIAAGLKLDFSHIKGLEEIEETYTLGDSSKILKTFSNSGITTIYNTDAADATWIQMQKLIEKAKTNKNLKAIFTQPNTNIKCAGAAKEIVSLTHSRLVESNIRNNVDLEFCTSLDSMIEVEVYNKAISEQFTKRDITYNYKHNLISVDIKNKIASFEVFDDKSNSIKIVDKNFDFLHITPSMKAPDEIMNSKLGLNKTWFPVNRETLQHRKYKNVFALGDIIDAPMGKTGGSIRKQYKVLVDNLILAMEDKELSAKYDGYTVYPIITDIGKTMLAEFNWTKEATPSFPLDATKDRYIWWIAQMYLLKPLTQYGMLFGKA